MIHYVQKLSIGSDHLPVRGRLYYNISSSYVGWYKCTPIVFVYVTTFSMVAGNSFCDF